ncbi:mitochondrial ribonuclease P protein 1 homolog [Teleopsis dalmanni]|uniref:mitochondrial ribonuclease P protein 1 homolog n=1 Tax=Teleopsis dalmanni TaxID=139649 RepID=UPI0018CDDCCB|nr:mitochondrial ribonuclease P protein 1 homolog [Teleopsis dalmanni]
MLKAVFNVTGLSPISNQRKVFINAVRIYKRALTTEVKNSAALKQKDETADELKVQKVTGSLAANAALTQNITNHTIELETNKINIIKEENKETQTIVQNFKNPFGDKHPQKQSSEPAAPVISDEERERRLKVLKLEVDIANQEGRRVPSLEFFEDKHWEHILTLPTKSARSRYYAYLWQIQVKSESKQRKKEERAVEIQKRREDILRQNEENNHIIYGLNNCSFFLRIYDSTINHWMNNRLVSAMQYSPKLIMDCSYDRHMTKREAINASKQLMISFAENRLHDEPFDLHFCGANINSVCMSSLQRYIPTMMHQDFPMNVHEKCFTEIFPKENLVYLTPHCRNDLNEYNPDDIYIIGAMVDTSNNEPLSLAKAKKLGLRMARLPLEHYLQWGAGSGKSLTLNQMVSIMLDIKKTGDWMKALSHVPRRKVVNIEMEQTQNRKFLNKRANQFNIRTRGILDEDDFDNNNSNRNDNKVRVFKDNMEFNLNTWASKKRNKNS